MSSSVSAIFVFLLGLWMTLDVSLALKKTDELESSVRSLTMSHAPDKFEPVKHQTSLGIIEGHIEDAVGQKRLVQNYFAFRGIPYAHPPIGDLRFADPVDAVEPWPNNYLDATKFGNACSQFDNETLEAVGNEDCLFLNVFTPALPGTKSEVTGGLPVFFFIHGGGFIRGSSNSHPGGRLASQNIVLVTINYRLGAIGFLSTADKTIPGNFGFLDQVSALRWVQRNIAEFGGDPTKVTIGGFSAGSAFSQFHMMSPLSRGLFRGAVLLSGGAFCSWAVQEHPLDHAGKLSEALKCPSKSEAFRRCLAHKTTEEILMAQTSVMRYEFWPAPFALTVDGGIREKPAFPTPVSELTLLPLPVLVGETPEEGTFFASNTLKYGSHLLDTKDLYNELARYIVSSIWFKKYGSESVAAAAETFYYTPQAKTCKNVFFEELSEVLMDYLFHACMLYGASQSAKAGSEVYLFLFTHRDKDTPIRSEAVYQKGRSAGISSELLETAVTHGDNLPFLFSSSEFSSEIDEKVANIFTENVVSFVTKGSPAVPKSEWPSLKLGDPVRLYEISLQPGMQKTPFRQKESNFWLQTIPLVINKKNEEHGGQSVLPWVVGALTTYFAFHLMNRR